MLKVIKVSAADTGAPSATVTDGTFLDWADQAKNAIDYATWWVANGVGSG